MVNQVQVSRPPAVPLGDKFACIALGHPVRHELPGEIALPSGARIYTAAPFDVGEDWLRSLGTLQAETLARSELVLLKTMPSANPAVVDHENEKLRRDVVNLMRCLLMHSVPHHDGMLEASGANDGGELQVRTVAFHRYLAPRAVRPPAVSEAMLRRADRAAIGLSRVRDARAAGSTDFRRLDRGLRSWDLGTQEENLGDRLHLVVRALEACIKPPVERSKTYFKFRGQDLIGESSSHRNMLGQLYDLRSCAEHLHGLECGLNEIPPDFRPIHTAMRAAQAELIAGEVLLRVLSSPSLLEHFRTDAGIDAFWALRPDKRALAWGTAIPYVEMTRERFFPEDLAT